MAVFAVVGVIPDFDLLAAMHRGPTHSLTAAAMAGVAAWMWCTAVRARRRGAPGQEVRPRPGPLRLALAVSAAYATHTLLDWLGADTSSPVGIMALWPASRGYYESQRHVFLAISRRYWLPDFWTLNLYAVAREVAILGPLAAVVVWLRSGSRRGRKTES